MIALLPSRRASAARRGRVRGLSALRRRARSARGSVSIEMVILLPLALTLLFLVVQGAVYYYARSAAMSSAQDGALSASAYESGDAAGEQRALEFAAQIGGDGVLEDPSVEVTRDEGAGTVTVTVTGTTMSLVPGWDPEVSQSATRDIEEFTAPKDYQKRGNPYGDDPRYETRPMSQEEIDEANAEAGSR